VRAAAGLREGDLLDPERMLELDPVAAILVSAAEELEDPAFGLHLGANFDLGALGLVTYAVLNASTVEIGLNNLVRYLGTLVEGVRAELATSRGVSVLRATLEGVEPEALRHVYEGGLLLLLRMLRRLVGDAGWRPRGVAMVHDAPDNTSEHVRLFGVEPTFGQPSIEIRFDASVLHTEVSGADRSLLPVVEQRLQEVLGAEPGDEPWLAKLRVQIASRFCDGHPSLPNLAPGIGVSARTLQRHLAERGLAYRDLVQQARCRLALQYLERTDTDLTEIAFLLGYSELSAFAHAFRRWTGRSPGAHRRARRAVGRDPARRRAG
jgi:AraC-like DNA-binding protein